MGIPSNGLVYIALDRYILVHLTADSVCGSEETFYECVCFTLQKGRAQSQANK